MYSTFRSTVWYFAVPFRDAVSWYHFVILSSTLTRAKISASKLTFVDHTFSAITLYVARRLFTIPFTAYSSMQTTQVTFFV